MNLFNLIKKLFFFLSCISIIASCNSNDNDTSTEGSSFISVKLMDDPGDYEHVYIDVVDVMVKVNDNSDGENGWQSIDAINAGIYDLLELTGGVNVILADDYEVPSGTLNQIRLILGEDNSVVIDGETYPLQTPSAQQSGLKIQVNQELDPLISYTFLLDFDVDESIVEAGNSGNIILKPVIRASLEEETGAIIGTVVAPEDVQVEVSTELNGDTISAYVNDDGSFALVGLLEGTYDVVFTPDPDSELDVIVVEDVNVTVGNVTDIGEISFN